MTLCPPILITVASGQDSEVCRRLRGRLKLRVGQRSLHEERLQFRRRFGHEVLSRRWFKV